MSLFIVSKIISLFEKHLGKLLEGIPVTLTESPKTIPTIGTTKDNKSPTGLKPATISSFTYVPR